MRGRVVSCDVLLTRTQWYGTLGVRVESGLWEVGMGSHMGGEAWGGIVWIEGEGPSTLVDWGVCGWGVWLSLWFGGLVRWFGGYSMCFWEKVEANHIPVVEIGEGYCESGDRLCLVWWFEDWFGFWGGLHNDHWCIYWGGCNDCGIRSWRDHYVDHAYSSFRARVDASTTCRYSCKDFMRSKLGGRVVDWIRRRVMDEVKRMKSDVVRYSFTESVFSTCDNGSKAMLWTLCVSNGWKKLW